MQSQDFREKQMVAMWSRAAAGVLLFGALVTGPAANAAPSADRGHEARANGPQWEPVDEAVTRSVRLALRSVVIADENRDGVISAREARRYYEARFDVMDLDQDRVLSRTEFVEGRSLPAARGSARRAAGRHRARGFEALDLDGDGALGREEFALAVKFSRTSDGATRQQLRSKAFGAFDQDGDGVLSEREFAAAGERHFADSDADGDGRVSIWEFIARLRF